MSWPEAFFFPNTVKVRNKLGSGGMGTSYGAPRSIAAETIDRQELVRNTAGQEVVSSSRVTVHLTENVPLGSLVTVWPGQAGEREAEVLHVSRDENPAPLPSHLILWLK